MRAEAAAPAGDGHPLAGHPETFPVLTAQCGQIALHTQAQQLAAGFRQRRLAGLVTLDSAGGNAQETGEHCGIAEQQIIVMQHFSPRCYCWALPLLDKLSDGFLRGIVAGQA